MRNGKTYPAINWRKANVHELEHKRIIIRTNNNTVIDSWTRHLEHVSKLIDPDQYLLQLETGDSELNRFIVMFINVRNGERRLNPIIRSLTILDSPTATDSTQERK